MSRIPACHPDRPYVARNMCRSCYKSWHWYRQRERLAEEMRRPCALGCGAEVVNADPRAIYCSRTCNRAAQNLASRKAKHLEEFYAVRSRKAAEMIARCYLERGCKRVGSRTALRRIEGGYVAAWHRGEGLFIVRARLPEEYLREEAA